MNIYPYFLWIIVFFFLVSCNKDESDVQEKYDCTVIIYMCADNNIDLRAQANIEQLTSVVLSENDNLIIYIDQSNLEPYIMRIKDNRQEVIKSYIEHNSADPLILNQVLSEIISLYPSDSYRLVLWSHGTSWVPRTRSFGYDNGNEMEIIDLANALPVKFESIIFDACLMGGIEVAYELRDKTNYLLFSPTDVLSYGFPYDEMTYLLFGDVNDLIMAARVYYDYYNKLSGIYQSASVSVVSTKELEKLASLTSEVLTGYPLEKWNYNYKNIQLFDHPNDGILFDFYDFLEKNYSQEVLSDIKKQLEKTVLFKAHTESILQTIDINSFSGFSCYAPQKQYEFYNNYYQLLQWCKNSGWFVLFK